MPIIQKHNSVEMIREGEQRELAKGGGRPARNPIKPSIERDQIERESGMRGKREDEVDEARLSRGK